MHNQAKSSRNRGSVLRPVLGALLMLGGVALLARAGSPSASSNGNSSGSTQVKQAVAAVPGVPRFQNYPAPPGIADDVGEPSIGCNWKSDQIFSNSMFSIPNGGRVMLFGGFSPELYRATFNDCSSPAKPNWEAKPLLLASTPRAAGDPILFTDHDTGRTFVSQLEGLTPAGSTTDITDDDGDNFTPSEGSSLPSDIDHQTFGGGIFHAGGVGPVTAYPNAVYYASQRVSDARAAQSQDGGLTFGPAFPMYTINDGAVSPGGGLTWEPRIDVDATVINGNPNKNAAFVPATAGSGGRPAVAFFGTETGGNNWSCGEGDDCSLSVQGVSTGINARPLFTGIWYLYISTTFDGGKTWTTQNVTLGDPIQRGGICGGSTCRNLLD